MWAYKFSLSNLSSMATPTTIEQANELPSLAEVLKLFKDQLAQEIAKIEEDTSIAALSRHSLYQLLMKAVNSKNWEGIEMEQDGEIKQSISRIADSADNEVNIHLDAGPDEGESTIDVQVYAHDTEARYSVSIQFIYDVMPPSRDNFDRLGEFSFNIHQRV